MMPRVLAKAPWRRGDLLAGLGVLAVALLLLHEVALEGRVLYFRDVHLVWHSEIAALRRAIGAGSLPVWDDLTGFGQPLLADPGRQALYPPTWLGLLLSPARSYSLFAVSHLVLAGLGVLAVARRFGFSVAAAFLSAAAWTASGPLVSLVSLWHHFAGASWLPWVVWAAERLWSRPGPGGAALLAVAFGMQVLAGSADMCLVTLAVVAALAAGHLLGAPRKSPRSRTLGWLLLAFGLAAGLTAALWLPALALVRESARSGLPESMRTAWSLHPVVALQAAWPIPWHELPLAPERRAAWQSGREPFLLSVHLGAPVLVLALAALAGPRHPRRFVLAGIAAGATLLAAGPHLPVYGALVRLLPPLETLRYPVKAMVPAAFAVALLAGLGLDAWRDQRSKAALHRATALLLLGAALLGAGAWAIARAAPDRVAPLLLAPTPAQPNVAAALAEASRPLAPAALLALLAAAFAWARARGASPALTAGGVSAAALAGLVVAHASLNLTAPPSFFAYRPPLLDVLGLGEHQRLFSRDYVRVSREALDRYAVPRTTDARTHEIKRSLNQVASLSPPSAARWGLPGSFETDLKGLYAAPLAALVKAARAADGSDAQVRLLRLGAVSRVVALQELPGLALVTTVPALQPEPIRVLAVPDPLPRTYAVGASRVAPDAEALALLQAPGFDVRSEVLLDRGVGRRAGAAFEGASRIVALRPDRVRLEARLSEPGYVVLVDAYDPGWKASVSGRPAELLRANTAFRAVAVGAGEHAIELVYRPDALRQGVAVSVAALVGLAALLAVAWRESGPPDGRPEA
jgi:hypothetical protein